MTKLYYSFASCGAAAFIAAFAGKADLETETVDPYKHITSSGTDFYTINPKGNLPCLVLDSGIVLNENSSVLQYISDLVPGVIAPLNGTEARYEVQNILSYIGTEFHANMGGWLKANSDEVRANYTAKLHQKMEYYERVIIADKQFVVGDSLTIADIYLWIALRATPRVKLDLTTFPRVKAYFERLKEHESIQGALARMQQSPEPSTSN